jgi:hypothetical protein
MIAYAKLHNLEYHVSPDTHDPFWNPVCFPWLANPNYNPGLPTVVVEEMQHNYEPIPFSEEWRSQNIRLAGYYQSYLYLDMARDEILKALKFNNDYNSQHVKCTAVHLRFGDYKQYTDLHPIVTSGYLEEAVKYMQRWGENHFDVLSDEPAIARQYLEWIQPKLDRNADFHVFEPKDALDDMRFYSEHDNQIISNSSFSSFAAWANPNPDKIVVSPSKENWFGSGNKKNNTSTIIPPEWHQIVY